MSRRRQHTKGNGDDSSATNATELPKNLPQDTPAGVKLCTHCLIIPSLLLKSKLQTLMKILKLLLTLLIKLLSLLSAPRDSHC